MKYILLLNILSLPVCHGQIGFMEVDRNKYDDGKSQFELMDRNSQMPRYGHCWKDAIVTIKRGCKHLTDVIQSKLALSYLNCFLEIQGKTVYHCDWEEPISYCTKSMSDVDRGAFTTFFTYTHNICYFLESQVWHEETEETILRLSRSSEEIAGLLEETSKLQEAMLSHQNLTLQNQEIILDKAANLNTIITTSSENINHLFADLKNTTNEHRLLISDIFNKVANLQTMVLGEFSGFYSMIYYTFSILLSFFLTSTMRTQSARFWLFGVMTIGIIAERMMVWTLNGIIEEDELEEIVYKNQWLCRKLFGCLGLTVLAIAAYRYRDINVINNQLLMDIKRQNSEIQHYILKNSSAGYLGDTSGNKWDQYGSLSSSSPPKIVAADSTGYESDSAVSDCSDYTDSNSEATDHTYYPALIDGEQSGSSSYTSAISESSGSVVTDVKEFQKPAPDITRNLNIESWAQTGYYRHSTPKPDDPELDSSIAESVKRRHKKSNQRTSSDLFKLENSTEKDAIIPAVSPRYSLRPRLRQKTDNPVTRSESPRSFSRVVKQLEKVAIRNSMLATSYTIKQKNRMSGDESS